MNNLGPSVLDFFDVWEDINVIYKSPKITDIKDAKYVLIGEDHLNSLARAEHSKIIDQNVVPGSILLVEGFSALMEVNGKNRESALRMYQISEYAQKMLTVIGWDRFNHIAKPRKHVYVCDYNKDSGYSSVSLDPEILTLADKLSLLKEAKSYKNVESEEFKNLEEVMNSREEVLQEAREKYDEEIAETFPIRTSAMTHTLKMIEKQRLQGKIKGKVFLIAGRSHVQEKKTINDRRFSLNSLYGELQCIPAVVLASKTIDRPRSDLEKLLDRG
ncbi:hypothetical protein [Parachlamydia sp. AcF125]|uniref:hypothetical protein n=1 Tax=Parachlamydia sp. AcF125 TaxID=2795736 RepID=UPI001BC8F8D8|nr:hypothetical protein [Parachlamydia sp. AcF125]MBS4168724.1 hypothetical protein [Parachlamydia sp. AcF125]